jgi:hypothetical protein
MSVHLNIHLTTKGLKQMKYLIIIALALPLITACVHHHPTHRDGPGNSENAPGHNKHKHDHDNGKHKDKHD